MFTLDPDLEDNKLRSIIQRLAEDEEICKLVSDERMRCEQHKRNYSKLKTEFNRIAHDNRLVHSDLSNLQSQYNDLKDTSAKALNHMQTEISELKCQLEYLHTKLPTKAQEMQTKNKIFLKTESEWGQKVIDLLQQVESVKVSEAQLLSENQCLKSDLSRLMKSASQEKIELDLMHEKKYEKLKQKYETLKSQSDPKQLSLEHSLSKQNVELDELRRIVNSSNIEVRDLNKKLRQREDEIRELKDDLYKSNSTFSSREAQSTLELDKVQQILEDTNLKLEEEKKKCWDLTRTANTMKADIIKIQDQHTESAINHDALMSDQKVKHAIEKTKIQREADHYKRVSEEKESKILNLKAALDSLKIKHEMKIKAIKEEMLTIRLENAKREIELDAKATEYRATLEAVKQDIKENQELEKIKKLGTEDRTDSNKQRTMATLGSMIKQTGNDFTETSNRKEERLLEENQDRNLMAQGSEGEPLRTKKSRSSSRTSISVEKSSGTLGMKSDKNPNHSVKDNDATTSSQKEFEKRDPDILMRKSEYVSLKVLSECNKQNTSSEHRHKKDSQKENEVAPNTNTSKAGSLKHDFSKKTNDSFKNYDDGDMKEISLKDCSSNEKKIMELRRTYEDKTKANRLSYDDLYQRYTSLQTKHTQFSGILKKSPFSFEDKKDL